MNESDESDEEGETDKDASNSNEDESGNDHDKSSEEEDSDTRSENPDVEETTETRREDGVRPQRNRSQPNKYEPSFEGKSYGTSMMNITLNQVDRRSVYSTAVNVLFNQMTATKGLKMFGELAVGAMVFKEYKQLDDVKIIWKSQTE